MTLYDYLAAHSVATARFMKAEIKSGRVNPIESKSSREQDQQGANPAESKSGRSGVLAIHRVSEARFMKAETTRAETKSSS